MNSAASRTVVFVVSALIGLLVAGALVGGVLFASGVVSGSDTGSGSTTSTSEVPRRPESTATSPGPSRESRPRRPGQTRTGRAPRESVGPAVGQRYVFPVAGCQVDYAAAHHDYPATDIFAARGCAVVAPVSGRVDEVTRRDAWTSSVDAGATRGGRSVSVVGDDGVRYYGSHLESVAPGIRPGVRVHAGQRLGGVGDSGSAAGTGTHLHFGISWPTPAGHWWIRRGAVPPAAFLDAWRTGRRLSPADDVAAAERAAGDWSGCRSDC